jgi:hypothetical protein
LFYDIILNKISVSQSSVKPLWEVEMNRKELEQRLRQELALPYYNAKIAERDYSESEFQEMKAQLQADIEQYARDYVNESNANG